MWFYFCFVICYLLLWSLRALHTKHAPLTLKLNARGVFLVCYLLFFVMISASDAYKTRSHTPHFNATGLPLTPLESSLWFVISMNSFIMVCWIWSTKRSIKLWIKTATRLSKTTFYPLWPWPLGVVSSFVKLFFDQQPLASRLSVGAVLEGGSSHPLGLTSTLGGGAS